MQPVVIRNEETLKSLAEDMKTFVEEEESLPTSEYKYSDTPEEAIRNALEINEQAESKTGKGAFEDGGHNLILLNGHLITLALSLDKVESGREWHLSMGLVMMNGVPNRVPDKFANAVVNGFFDEYREDNPPKQGLSKIRHFFSPKKEAINAPDQKPESPAVN